MAATLYLSITSDKRAGLYVRRTDEKMQSAGCCTKQRLVLATGSGLGTYLPLLINDTIIKPKYAFLVFWTEGTVPYLESHFNKDVTLKRLRLFVELSQEDKNTNL